MWSPRWNDIDRGNQKGSEKNLSQCLFIHHRSHWTDPGANPGRRGERPATNRLSHGTAKMDLREIGCGLDSSGSGQGPVVASENTVMDLRIS
jgi:hypothetical protein